MKNEDLKELEEDLKDYNERTIQFVSNELTKIGFPTESPYFQNINHERMSGI